MVSYQKGSVSQLEVVLKDVDVKYDDNLIKKTIDIPTDYDKWVDLSLSQDNYSSNISLWRSTTPVFTEEEHQNMNLQEKIFDLEDGSKAILSYSVAPSNEKAVLYFPGKEDAFTHPNVLRLYQEKGYDLFALDARFCGRARRFMDESDFRQSHSIANFDTYREEVALALDFIQSQNKTYTKPLAHAHSTGALVALNYAMLVDEEPFDGYVLNGPFLDWGRQSTLNEFLLENAGFVSWFGIHNAKETGSLTKYHVDNWILHRFNTLDRPIISGHTTLEWAQASTNVQNKILNTPKSQPITATPVLLIASLGDVILTTSESEDRMPHIATNYSKVILDHQSHDVTYSTTPELCEEAIDLISDWLDNPAPTDFSSSSAGSFLGRGYAAWLFSGVIGLLVMLL
jgi:alpha-beta hydrolase superfamily lysophospholipase